MDTVTIFLWHPFANSEEFSEEIEECLFSSFFGGSMADFILGVTVDSENNIICVGTTHSTDIFTLNAFQEQYAGGTQEHEHGPGGDGFIFKMTQSGEILWSTYFGGSDLDWFTDVDTDLFNNTIVVCREEV